MSGAAINMDDAGVRSMLGLDRPRLATGKRDLVHVAGDVPPPDGGPERGIMATTRLDRNAVGHPVIVHKDGIMVADVYEVAGEPMKVVIICPRCHHALNIPGDKKRIEFDRVPGAPNPSNADLNAIAATMSKARIHAFGKLSIEPFECTWEMGVHRGQFGVTLCRWKAAIDENVAKDA